jgi:hypothetical protein
MTSSALFSIIGKEVVVTNLSTGEVAWAGRPLDRAVLDLAQLPGRSRAVALLDYYRSAPGDRPNLVAIDEHGEVLWRAKLPTTAPTDAFTEMELVGEGVSAFSSSGHRVLIDPESGAILEDRFAK